jgi:HupE / UreJ protein
VGLINHTDPVLELSVQAPAPATSSLFGVGFDHFREGPDHLLFLALIALRVARRRAGPAATARRLAALTVTFTVGHSASLALAALGLVSAPTRLVETAIAVTIVLAAVHAVRPLAPARAEIAVTGAFGLIHGFGFASTLTDLSLTGSGLVLPLLAFATWAWRRHSWRRWHWSSSRCGSWPAPPGRPPRWPHSSASSRPAGSPNGHWRWPIRWSRSSPCCSAVPNGSRCSWPLLRWW